MSIKKNIQEELNIIIYRINNLNDENLINKLNKLNYLIEEINDNLDDIEYQSNMKKEFIDANIINQIEEYKRNKEFINNFYPLFHLLYNSYINN